MHSYEDVLREIQSEFDSEIENIEERNLRGILPMVLSRQEIQTLIDFYSDRDKKTVRNRLIIKTLYYTGMRIGELADLRKTDINFNNELIFIRSGKGDKDRYVCIDPETLRELQIWTEKLDLMTNIFDISERQMRRIIETAGTETGVAQRFEAAGRKFSAHSLRHAFATHFCENGINIFTLKKLLGHEFLDTTEIYISTSMKFDQTEYLNSIEGM